MPVPPGPRQRHQPSVAGEKAHEVVELLAASDDRRRRCREAPPRAYLGRVDVEGGILPEDRPLELSQLRARLQPELLDEPRARVSVDGKRIRLAARPVERERELSRKPLAKRMLRNGGLELPDHRRMATERELGVEAIFERREPELGQAGGLGRGEPQVRERFAPPQRQRLLQPCRSGNVLALGEELAPLRGQPFERERVELVAVDDERVAVGRRADPLGRQEPAELRDVDLECMRCRRRWTARPQLLDQRVARHRVVRPRE